MAENESGIWWFDITTLKRSLSRPGQRPTGIPRVAIELLTAARLSKGQRSVRLTVYDNALPGLRECDWDEFDAMLARAAMTPSGLPTLGDVARGISPDLADRLYLLKQSSQRFAATARKRLPRFNRRLDQGSQGFHHPFQEGDVWVNLGCWWHAELHKVLASIRKTTKVRTAILIHDCMPLMFPEYFPRDHVRDWQAGIDELLANTDLFLVGSRNTGADLSRLSGNELECISKIRLGDGFQEMSATSARSGQVQQRLGLEQPYVLVVGTIEARKNHALAFRAWRSMLNQGLENLPTLVFAGKWGWRIEDLKAQIRDSESLGDKLRIVESPADAELQALYQGAMLTLFPSLYEGWGLPVRESLAHGKICIAANNSSLVEAGGVRADYFESDCQQSLISTLMPYLFDEQRRQSREANISEGFQLVSWEESWGTVAAALTEMEASKK